MSPADRPGGGSGPGRGNGSVDTGAGALRLEHRPFSLPLARPLLTAAGPIERREGVAVRLVAAEQAGGEAATTLGVGESTPLAGWTEALPACRRALAAVTSPRRALAEDTAGDTGDPEGPGSDRTGGSNDDRGASSPLTGRPAARHAVALALADRRARRAGVPLYRHLVGDASTEGDREPAPIAVNAVVGATSVEGAVERAEAAIAAGMAAVKLKVGVDGIEADRERVAAVRRALGDGPAIRLDANGAWDVGTAERALEAVAPHDVEYVEQPVPPGEEAALDGRDPPVDVALDESFVGREPDQWPELLEATDVVIVKPMALGGLDRAMALCEQAADRGRRTVVTTTVDGVIARTAAVHLAAAVAPEEVHGLATADRLARDLGPDPAPVVDGRIAVPTAPGLGTDGPWEGAHG